MLGQALGAEEALPCGGGSEQNQGFNAVAGTDDLQTSCPVHRVPVPFTHVVLLREIGPPPLLHSKSRICDIQQSQWVPRSEKTFEPETGSSREPACPSASRLVGLGMAERGALGLRHADLIQPHPEWPGSGCV